MSDDTSLMWLVQPSGDDGEDFYAVTFEETLHETREAAVAWLAANLPRLQEEHSGMRVWAEIKGGTLDREYFEGAPVEDFVTDGCPSALVDVTDEGDRVEVQWQD